jgi:hypothetical protein
MVEVYGRLEVSFCIRDLFLLGLSSVDAAEMRKAVIVLALEGRSDNDGYLTPGCGPYDHCARAVPLPLEALEVLEKVLTEKSSSSSSLNDVFSVSFIAPAVPQIYEARLMVTPRSGVPMTIARSHSVDVRMPPDFFDRPRGEVFGNVTIAESTCVVGETVLVRYNITSSSGGRLLCPLDRLVFYPVGRPEGIVHHEMMVDAVGLPVYANTLRLKAPLSEGSYNVALYSAHEQQCVCVANTTLLVTSAEIHVAIDQSAACVKQRDSMGHSGKVIVVVDGGVVPFTFRISSSLYRASDRVMIYDQCANLVGDGFTVADSSSAQNTRLVTGTASATLCISGTYSAHYYSSAAGRIIQQVQSYILVKAPAPCVLPFAANLSVLRTIRSDVPLEIIFTRSATDADLSRLGCGSGERSHAAALQDCLAIFPADSRDSVMSRSLTDPDRLPCVYLHYLRGASNSHIKLPSMTEIIRSAAMLKDMNLVDEELARRWANTRDWSVRYLVVPFVNNEVGVHFHRLCVSEASFTVLRPEEAADFVPIPLHLAPLRNLAAVSHRVVGVDAFASTPSPSSAGTPLATASSKQHPNAQGASLSTMNRPVATPVALKKNTEFAGALLVGPANTGSQVHCTFHVTSGCPRLGDKILLYTKDVPTAVSEGPVRYAVNASADMTLGTLMLNPPTIEGLYSLGYFSEKAGGVVFSSEPFRVHRGDVPFAGVHPNNATAGERKKPLLLGKDQPTAASALLEPAASPSGAPGRVKILIVGVSYLRRPYEITGCLNDVEDFAAAAASFFFGAPSAAAVGPDKMRILHEMHEREAMPTAARIRSSLDWLADGARPGDHLVFFFSGGGSMVDGIGRCLLPCDYDWGPRLISLKEIEQRLAFPDSKFGSARPSTKKALNMNQAAVSLILDTNFWPNSLDAFRHLAEQPVHISSTSSSRAFVKEDHPLVAAGQRRRASQSQSRTYTWRGVLPPHGVFPPTRHDRAHKKKDDAQEDVLVTQPYANHRTVRLAELALDDARRCRLLVLESSSASASSAAGGAVEAFLRAAGKTMGLFTYNLCSVLTQETQTRANNNECPSLQWWELYERVSRGMRLSNYAQQPRFLVSHVEMLDRCVRYGSQVLPPAVE